MQKSFQLLTLLIRSSPLLSQAQPFLTKTFYIYMYKGMKLFACESCQPPTIYNYHHLLKHIQLFQVKRLLQSLNDHISSEEEDK
jgi:hypothetical protein